MSPSPRLHPMPLVRMDLAVLSVREEALCVLLAKRSEPPYKGRLGLPGGVLRIDLDASLEAAAQRVARERLGRELTQLEQLVAVGAADRDPRAPWSMTVVYRSLVQPDMAVAPGKRIESLVWRGIDEIEGEILAFDHNALVARAAEMTRGDIERLRLPTGWLNEPFTLGELHQLCETVLGSHLDKVSFRRRIDATQVVQPIEGLMRTGRHRPAQLYRLNESLG